jgi:ketosteroid isomerase-like protein
VMTDGVPDQELDDLIRRVEDAATAIISGDIGTYVALINHADDYTLMAPSGGAVRHGFDRSPESLAQLSRFFQGGTATLEIAQTYRSGDLVVLVLVERQRGRVGSLPEQDLSLRVTLVFRRDGSDWLLVHRHADPLVSEISPEQWAALTRG